MRISDAVITFALGFLAALVIIIGARRFLLLSNLRRCSCRAIRRRMQRANPGATIPAWPLFDEQLAVRRHHPLCACFRDYTRANAELWRVSLDPSAQRLMPPTEAWREKIVDGKDGSKGRGPFCTIVVRARNLTTDDKKSNKRAPFPLDMLRYDCAWPATEADTTLLASQLGGHRLTEGLTLRMLHTSRPTFARWNAYGWHVDGQPGMHPGEAFSGGREERLVDSESRNAHAMDINSQYPHTDDTEDSHE